MKKIRRDVRNLLLIFYDASKVILAGVVIGGITPLYTEPTIDLNLYVVVAGVIVTVLLAWIGNKILK